ncbi:MAG: alginate export family protein, partial [Pseudomonadota bacterium]
MKRSMVIGGAAVCLCPAVLAQEPFRLDAALGAEDWLTIKGEARARYETLDGQFRADLEGSDQGLLTRFLLLAEADAGPFDVGVEIQDARVFLDDSGSPVSRSFVNTLNVLQAYAKFKAPGFQGQDSWTDVFVGRQTISIGSKRQVQRVSYANVINGFTGVHAIGRNPRGDEAHVFLAVPVDRRPEDRDRVGRIGFQFDREQFGRRVYALHYRRADAFPSIGKDIWGEAYLYGLDEVDTDAFQTPNRSYLAPGFRVFRAESQGQWDIDVEIAGRFGSRRATSDPSDEVDLDVAAARVHAEIGYTFDTPWRIRIGLDYDLATGDRDPNDGRFDQYERLFDARRTDLNNTSLHGPLTTVNLDAPGARIEFDRGLWDGRVSWKAASLASETDAFVIARLRDPEGESGSFVGHS